MLFTAFSKDKQLELNNLDNFSPHTLSLHGTNYCVPIQ